MTDLAWPSGIIPASAEWRYVASTATFGPRSATRSGDRWAVTLVLPVLPRTAAATMRAFLARLRGATNRVVLPHHAYRRLGALTLDGKVAGAAQTGTTLVVDGLQAGVSDALRTGDWIGVGGRLYMVAADCDTTAAGVLTVTLCNPIVTAPADNATVQIVTPTARFVLTERAQWDALPMGNVQFAPIELLEDIP